MKKIALAVIVLRMLAAVPAHANGRQGDHMLYHGYWGHDRDQTSDPIATSNPASVPEPSSVLMFGSGLLTLAGIGLLRRKNAV
jgi:PEP-CTERM motif